MKGSTETEKIILQAARNVFAEKGHDGARMQEIADRAHINKAMLHYYFRSKEKLFERIFTEAFQEFWPVVAQAVSESKDVRDFVKNTIGNYVDMFITKPYLPIFILTEVNRNPERLETLLKEGGVNPKLLFDYLQSQMDLGTIKSMNPKELLVNVISLSIFPFAAKPLLERFTFNGDKMAVDAFLKARKDTVYEFIEPLIFLNR